MNWGREGGGAGREVVAQGVQGLVGRGEDLGVYPEGGWEPLGLDTVWGSA